MILYFIHSEFMSDTLWLYLYYRLFFVGGRNGHMPQILSYVQVNRMTPAPAVFFVVSFLTATDIYRKFNNIKLSICFTNLIKSSFMNTCILELMTNFSCRTIDLEVHRRIYENLLNASFFHKEWFWKKIKNIYMYLIS